jgi:hypothetical protein
MSMNFSEFEQAGGKSDAAFEQRLLQAARLPLPGDLMQQLEAMAAAYQSAGTEQPAGTGLFYRFRYALAALLVLAAGATLLLRQPGPAESVEAYVAHHFEVDGYAMLAAGSPNPQELPAILSGFKLGMSPELASQVRFVKYCPTPEGRGIHLVLGTEQGLVTVLLMPGLEVTEGAQFTFDELAAELINLPGLDISAAIVASPGALGSAPQESSPGASPGGAPASALAVALQQGVWRQSTGA